MEATLAVKCDGANDVKSSHDKLHDCACCVPRRLYKLEQLLPFHSVDGSQLLPPPPRVWRAVRIVPVDAPPTRPIGLQWAWASQAPPSFS